MAQAVAMQAMLITRAGTGLPFMGGAGGQATISTPSAVTARLPRSSRNASRRSYRRGMRYMT
ncbi:hypothetical protein ACFQ9X_15765 [Catenulispora yoronensis]